MFSHFTADDSDNIFDNGSCLSLGSHTFNDLHLPQAGCFSTLYMNSRSLCRHDIQDYLSTLEFPFSIYGFTETRFRGSSPPYITMPDHTLVLSSRSKEVGGGVAIFVKNSLNFRVREDLMPLSDDYIH